ncbi:MAG: DUF4476 domain-containing protein [Taibaiella sp.]|nr:DUF4476 domain-containing protein [Taibaiella sp.]
MKTIAAILGILFTNIISSSAQSMLKVALTDRTPVTISVDGRYFNKRGETVTVGDLPQGRHYLKIFVANQDRRGNTVERTVYEGRIKTYRGQLTTIVADTYNGTTVTTDDDIQPTAYTQVEQGYNNRNLNNYDQRQNDTSGGNNSGNQNNDDYNAQGSNNQYNNAPAQDSFFTPPLPDGMPLASPVTPEEEEPKAKKATPTTKPDKLKKKVTALKTDTDKFNTLKEELKNQKLTTARVCTIMEWLTFESSKVDFAQWAYPNITDQKNFSKVKDKLPSKSYKTEIDKFIKQHK